MEPFETSVMEENDLVVERDKNPLDFNCSQRSETTGNSPLFSAAKDEVNSRNEPRVEIRSESKCGIAVNETVFSRKEEICDIPIATDVNKMSGLGFLAVSYSCSENEIMTEGSDSVENYCSKKMENNNSVNTAVEKGTYLEEQKNKISSVELMENKSKIVELESEVHVMKPKESNRCNPQDLDASMKHNITGPANVQKTSSNSSTADQVYAIGKTDKELEVICEEKCAMPREGFSFEEQRKKINSVELMENKSKIAELDSEVYVVQSIESNRCTAQDLDASMEHKRIGSVNVQKTSSNSNTADQVNAMGKTDKELEVIREEECVVPREGSSFEEQKNNIDSVMLVEDASKIAELDSEVHVVKSTESKRCTAQDLDVSMEHKRTGFVNVQKTSSNSNTADQDNAMGNADKEQEVIREEECAVPREGFSFEEQRNKINSVALMEDKSMIAELDSGVYVVQSIESNTCTPQDLDASMEHKRTGSVNVQKTSSNSSTADQVNAMGKTDKEQEVICEEECAVPRDSVMLVEDTSKIAGLDSDVHVLKSIESNSQTPQDLEANFDHKITGPINVQGKPSDFDTVNEVYAMDKIDKELEVIHEEGGAVQREEIKEDDSSSGSDDEGSSSESSTSSDSSTDKDLEDIRKEIEQEEEKVQVGPMKTKSEILIKELPEVPNLDINIDDNVQLVELGFVFSIVECLVVVKALPQTPALDADSILFLENRSCLGLVFETFGPVQKPFYSVRFNKESDISDKNVHVEDKVFYAPEVMEFSHYVFVSQLKKLKGSDASWEHDEEPPQEAVEYSDDEEEAKAKASRKKERMAKSGCAENATSQKMDDTGQVLHQGANRGNRKRTWQNRARAQPVNQNTSQTQNQGMPHKPAAMPRGPAPWHGHNFPPQVPWRPFMENSTSEARHFGMGPMVPPRGIPPRRPPPYGPPLRGPLDMVPPHVRQMQGSHSGIMGNPPRLSYEPPRPLSGGPGFQGPWPVAPPSCFAPRQPIALPQGLHDPGFQNKIPEQNFLGMHPPPPMPNL